jgi:hypothetical protein
LTYIIPVPQQDARPRTGRSTNPLLSLGRELIRSYGKATAGMRPDPDFLVIGAKRGGSTSFYYDLLQHPHLCPLFPRPDRLPKAEPTKGIHFFDQNYDRGERWYRAHLPSRFVRRRMAERVGSPVLVGEASPYYLFHPLAAQRAAALVPDAKIIAVLRDPAQRAYSHWKERRRSHREDLDFEGALAAEAERLGDAEHRLASGAIQYSYAHEQQSYAQQSEYAPALARWYAHFPRERILILASEDYYADPENALGRAQEFLGLPLLPLGSGGVRNAAVGDQLDPILAGSLARRFAEPNARLRELTGRDFPWSS